jgi:antitoxin ParD1/3/4
MRAKTPTMNVSLTDALRDVVDERLRSGLYGNASEYVRELIRRDEEAARQLRALYQAGIDSGEPVPMSDEDWEALRAVARSPATRQA